MIKLVPSPSNASKITRCPLDKHTAVRTSPTSSTSRPSTPGSTARNTSSDLSTGRPHSKVGRRDISVARRIHHEARRWWHSHSVGLWRWWAVHVALVGMERTGVGAEASQSQRRGIKPPARHPNQINPPIPGGNRGLGGGAELPAGRAGRGGADIVARRV